MVPLVSWNDFPFQKHTFKTSGWLCFRYDGVVGKRIGKGEGGREAEKKEE